ncbi:hypothetical protein [Clostridium sp. SM-530-WT-3G]|uniref:hypothetical protein n=1 Tax=Clostridium sp. SM-530-WT-3G TaxID=2725303 RepID=UPI00145FCD35|nr:hypothetical protein [Clostridium sp. SM-530-WT-3G]NME83936.1 hypothetical protein [Clostridium sp. SM-530-WT-3G]
MSLFLGKIHYWLFNKILWFEGLEKEMINLAKDLGLDVQKIQSEIETRYEPMLPEKPLEELIDQGNIHGWLQNAINNAEGRMAAWTKVILSENPENITKIENIYIEQGIKAAKEVIETCGQINSAKEIYMKINDYILDGMPCDRVDEVIDANEECTTWRKTICVHKDIWEREGVSVEQFYKLRDLWIEAFVNKINSNFQYVKNADGTLSIKVVE